MKAVPPPGLFEKKLVEWEARADQRAVDRPGHYVERSRVAPIIEAWLDEYWATRGILNPQHMSSVDSAECHGAVETLSHMTGISVRQLALIRGQDSPVLRHKTNGVGRSWCIVGTPKYLTLDMLDRILTGMEKVELFHLPPEDGGFSDVYEHPSVMAMAA